MDSLLSSSAWPSYDLSGLSTLTSGTGCGANGSIADKSGFEDADGNLAIDKPGCMDWNGFAPLTWSRSVPYQDATKTSGSFTLVGVSDAFDSHRDTNYAGGVKQATNCPATGSGNVNNKDDLARIYVASSTDPVTKHVYLDLAWIRAPQNTTSSDVHVGFELNQSKTRCPGGSPLVPRTKGDVQLIYNFHSGVPTIGYSQWTGSTWTPEVTLAANIAEAAVFTASGSMTDAIKPSNGLNPATDEFGEAGIDLSAAIAGNGHECVRFATVLGQSRTSGSSTSAQLKDLVGPADINISNCVTPTLTTTQLPASGAVNSTFKDSARLDGAATPDGTGSITFTLYSAADCSGSVLDTETVSGISANGTYTTPKGYAIHSAGTYYWVATYTGDSVNNEVTSGCDDEPVQVGKGAPRISTTQQPASGSIGDTFKDTARLSDAVNLTGAGSITFTLYSEKNCGGSVLDREEVTGIKENGQYTTPKGVELKSPGTYYWVASFSGDSNNGWAKSDCNDEPVVVASSSSSSIEIVKTADAARVTIGDQIGFTLTVSNSGGSDAAGVTLTDPLPKKAGLSWQIDSQGAGWAGSCAITAGTLHCGPVTVPAGTTQAASTFTVHIISPTTAATGGFCPGGGGVVDNTGKVTSSNAGSDESSASTCVGGLDLRIVKKADAPQVSPGDQIGFTITVSNTGTGDAKGVTLSDPLPTNPGLSWQIDSQGAGWAGSCSITAGTLQCGPVTVPAGTTQAASTFTVHVISPTTAETGGDCPGSGTVDNTATVTATNDGSHQSEASTCVTAGGPRIDIDKTADAPQVNAGDQIGFTLEIANLGSGDALGVRLNDPLPSNPGLSWQIESQGLGWNGTCAIADGTLTCGPETVPAGTTDASGAFTVHVISTTTAATGGTCPGSGVVDNTATVTLTNGDSDEGSASTCVLAAEIHLVKTADNPQVNAGDSIGFTLTVYNAGAGDAKGVMVSDPLPTNAGLSWTIDNQGAGWDGTCKIVAKTLQCGPATVPAGTTQETSTFTVHVTSPTTAATGGDCPGGSGVVDNTGTVTAANDGSDTSTASTCVAGATIHILKTPDAAQVTEGQQIGFTMTVWNSGSGDAVGATLNDPLPTNAGLSWRIDKQGSGWAGTCAITLGTLHCGPVTVPAGTTQAASTFTVHIVSATTPATGGSCPSGSGVVENTGTVSTTNDGTDQSNASTCVQGLTDLQITKTGSPATQTVTGQPYGNITWTMVVRNNGPVVDTNVKVNDPMPANNTYVSSSTTRGTCIGGAILSCDLGTLQVGDSVTITLVTRPTITGKQVNTATVAGDLTETNLANNEASASVFVRGIFQQPCYALRVTARKLTLGKASMVSITVTQRNRPVRGVRVRITGGGVSKTTAASNRRGKITAVITPRTKGRILFRPLNKRACSIPALGATDVFAPRAGG